MGTLTSIVLFTLLGGAFSALAASLLLLIREDQRMRLLPYLVSFATGALLSAALAGLLPEALESVKGAGGTRGIGLTVLGGILTFFMLEKLVLWRHCHHDTCETHTPAEHHRDAASAYLVLIGNGFHNALDGVLMAAAFMTDQHLGVVTAVAIFAHEIPQEVGDLAILLHGGMKRGTALVLNLAATLTSVVGGVIAFYALESAMHYLPYAIAAAASSFIYIAVADLIPALHRRVDPASAISQVVLIFLGAAAIYWSETALH